MATPHKHIAFCPHCGNTTPQRVMFTHTFSTIWYEKGSDEVDRGGPELEAIVCICETCDYVLLYEGVSRNESGEWPQLRDPGAGELDRAVPHDIRSIYFEASRVKQHSPPAFALLIRRALEALCEDRGIVGRDLAARLKELAAKGDVPPVLAEMTEVLRTLGNTAAHGRLDSVTVPMTWAIDDFFTAVVEYVYVAPRKLADLKEKVAGLKKPTSAA